MAKFYGAMSYLCGSVALALFVVALMAGGPAMADGPGGGGAVGDSDTCAENSTTYSICIALGACTVNSEYVGCRYSTLTSVCSCAS
jgi:hypothetical protein